MRDFIRNLTISLKTALTSLIVVVIVFLVFNILFFAYQGNKYTTFKITEKLMYQIFSTTAEKLNFYFQSSTQSLKDIEFTLKKENFDLENKPEEFLAFLEKLLIINPSITGAYMGDSKGDFYMAKRMSDGSISYRLVRRTRNDVVVKWSHVNPVYEEDFPSGSFTLQEGYDPRKRPWYIKAKRENRTVWTDPYIFASDRLLGVSVASPISDGEIEGVFALDFGLAEINSFLKSLPISKSSSLFLFDREDRIIAYASPYNNLDLFYKEIFQEDGNKTIELLDIEDVKDPILSGLYIDYKQKLDSSDDLTGRSLYDNQFFITILNICIGIFFEQEEGLNQGQLFLEDSVQSTASALQEYNSQIFYSTYDFEDDSYLFMLNNFNIADSFDSKLGIIIPQSVVVSYFYYTYQFILFSTIFMVVVSLIIFIYIMNRSISKPILNLSNRMVTMVDKFQLSPFTDGQTKLKEIRYIQNSIENVRRALVSFKKYLPKEVVADLIKSGREAKIGGEKKEITIFFSDIKDFTTISEENPSDILFQKLENYFNIVDRYITKNNGILDKFIGDAVMALWGVPNPIPNHATLACLAALEIKQDLYKLNKKLENEEFPIFHTRIGIHTGVALVGNIGSENRLNYTCIGDEVNLASRLEGLNKFYRTQILASNITLQHAKEFIESRMVDRVMVKGKTQRVLIHEILAKKGELYGNDKEFLRSYKEGLRFYFQGYWENAINALNNALRLKKDDFITQLYLQKAESFVSKKLEEINPEEMYLDRRISR